MLPTKPRLLTMLTAPKTPSPDPNGSNNQSPSFKKKKSRHRRNLPRRRAAHPFLAVVVVAYQASLVALVVLLLLIGLDVGLVQKLALPLLFLLDLTPRADA